MSTFYKLRVHIRLKINLRYIRLFYVHSLIEKFRNTLNNFDSVFHIFHGNYGQQVYGFLTTIEDAHHKSTSMSKDNKTSNCSLVIFSNYIVATEIEEI